MANLSDPSVSLLFKDVPLTWRSFTHLGCRAEVRDTSCFCHILADSFSLNYSFCQGAIGEDRVSSTPWIQTRFCLSVICSWTLVLFHLLAIVSNAAMNRGVSFLFEYWLVLKWASLSFLWWEILFDKKHQLHLSKGVQDWPLYSFPLKQYLHGYKRPVWGSRLTS